MGTIQRSTPGAWQPPVPAVGRIARIMQVVDRSTSWQSLPPWITFFFDLGERVAAAHEDGRTTCTVVMPPVRSFAAVFAAAGAVVGVALTARSVPEIDQHFATLRALPPGTAVVVKMGERIYSAKFHGIEERRGGPFLRIEYNSMTQYLPKAECQRVQVGSGGKRSLPKVAQRGRASTSAAIEYLLSEYSGDFLSVPTVDAVLVGSVTMLEQELNGISIRSAAKPDSAAPLGALLRASRFLPDGGISRSLLLSDRVAEFEMPVDDTPHVVVFDGSNALARHRSHFRNSSWIAVLDRCSGSIAVGVDVANEEFAVRQCSADYLIPDAVPIGAEVQAFERAK